MSVDLLLDTHYVIWLVDGDEQARSIRDVLDDPASTVTVSAITWSEIAIKHALGKLHASVRDVRRTMLEHDLLELPFTGNHAEQLELLPGHHRDPFDRMLIAQALSEQLTMATVDPAFSAYAELPLYSA